MGRAVGVVGVVLKFIMLMGRLLAIGEMGELYEGAVLALNVFGAGVLKRSRILSAVLCGVVGVN